jgi:triosephosphate isomerase (TIM)
MRRKLAAGNWKMNGTSDSLGEVDSLIAAHPSPTVDIVICPPATLLSRMAGAPGGARSRSAGRIATPPPRARIPATSRSRCWPTRARAM